MEPDWEVPGPTEDLATAAAEQSWRAIGRDSCWSAAEAAAQDFWRTADREEVMRAFGPIQAVPVRAVWQAAVQDIGEALRERQCTTNMGKSVPITPTRKAATKSMSTMRIASEITLR